MDNPFSNTIDLVDLSAVSMAAKKDALAGVPSESDRGLPEGFVGVNNQLRRAFDAGVEKCQQELNEVENFNEQLKSGINPVTLASNAGQIISEMSDRLDHSGDKAKVRYHKQEFLNRKDDLQRFKLENEIIYDPSRGTEKSPLPFGIPISVGIVSLLYILESAINAAMFLSAKSLIEGLTISLSTSLVNVVLGFFFGRFVLGSLFYHSSKKMRLAMGATAIAFTFVILWLNLMVAVVRSLYQADIDNPYEAVSTAAAVWPFGSLHLITLEGALLVGVGSVFAFVSIMDGWFSDDPHPGYGRKFRTCLKQKYEVEKYLSNYRELYHKETSEARFALNSFFENTSNLIEAWGRNINLIQKRFIDYEDWVESLRIVQTNAWKTYVASHERNRLDTYAPPENFDQLPEFYVSQPDHDPSHVFSDVAYSYMSDEERTKKMDEFKSVYAEHHDRFVEQLESAINRAKIDLIELEKEAECHI